MLEESVGSYMWVCDSAHDVDGTLVVDDVP